MGRGCSARAARAVRGKAGKGQRGVMLRAPHQMRPAESIA
jgi:hypothetical protein